MDIQEGELNIKCDRVQHFFSLCSDASPSQQRGDDGYTNTRGFHANHGHINSIGCVPVSLASFDQLNATLSFQPDASAVGFVSKT